MNNNELTAETILAELTPEKLAVWLNSQQGTGKIFRQRDLRCSVLGRYLDDLFPDARTWVSEMLAFYPKGNSGLENAVALPEWAIKLNQRLDMDDRLDAWDCMEILRSMDVASGVKIWELYT